jgi:hypothetical protein
LWTNESHSVTGAVANPGIATSRTAASRYSFKCVHSLLPGYCVNHVPGQSARQLTQAAGANAVDHCYQESGSENRIAVKTCIVRVSFVSDFNIG